MTGNVCEFVNGILESPALGRLFRTPALGTRADPDSYTGWEFENAEHALTCFKPNDGIEDKFILDVGCGFGGKSIYYALHGARHVTAIDLDEMRIGAAREYAAKKHVSNIRFDIQDAASLRFDNEQFDLVIFSDSFEHVNDPAAVLRECNRVLRKGGTVNIMFPPYNSPWGAHLFAYIRIPWAQLLFREEDLVRTWKRGFEAELEKGATVYSRQNIESIRKAATVSDLAHLNRMSIQRFERILQESGFSIRFCRFHTPGNLFHSLASSSICREYLVTRVVTVLEKQGEIRTDARTMANI